MKNIVIYVGTIKKCLNYENYLKDGDNTFQPDFQINHTQHSFLINNTKIISDQAILIKTKTNNMYRFRINSPILDGIKIYFDIKKYSISNKPNSNHDIFYEENSLKPYYEKQPKKVKIKTLKHNLLNDARIKGGIEY